MQPSQTLPRARDWPIQLRPWHQKLQSSRTPTKPALATPTQPGQGVLDLMCNWIPSKTGYRCLQLLQPAHRSKGSCTPCSRGEGWVSVPAKSLGREAAGISTEETDPDLCRAQLFLEGKSCSLMEMSQSLWHPGQLRGQGCQTGRHGEPGQPSVPDRGS